MKVGRYIGKRALRRRAELSSSYPELANKSLAVEGNALLKPFDVRG